MSYERGKKKEKKKAHLMYAPRSRVFAVADKYRDYFRALGLENFERRVNYAQFRDRTVIMLYLATFMARPFRVVST